MTNAYSVLKKIFKLALFLFLLFICFVILVIFLKFTEIEDRIKKGDTDYENFYSTDYQKDSLDPETAKNPQAKLIVGENKNYFLGASDPKITIVEFADFSCAYCKRSFPKIREISLLYKDEVKYIFRDLPIVNEYSSDLALAARCAGEQGLFWLMHDRLFIDQGISTKEEIFLSAKRVGVDMEIFSNCYDTKKYLPQIKKDMADAQALEVHEYGTPIWFINGQLVAGDIPEEIFKELIEKILK